RSIARIRHAGARGYMSKSESLEELKSAITRVIAGDYYPESFPTVGTTENSESSSLLSNRQRAILTLMKSGMSNSEMADTLYLSPNTIKTHIRLMYNTLDVTSRIECINKAETLGLLDR
ncbi:MAG: LuxR C-terminal-related transcriptional regulator, partial [Thalassolituus sp.]